MRHFPGKNFAYGVRAFALLDRFSQKKRKKSWSLIKMTLKYGAVLVYYVMSFVEKTHVLEDFCKTSHIIDYVTKNSGFFIDCKV